MEHGWMLPPLTTRETDSDGLTMLATGTVAFVKVIGLVVGAELVPDRVAVTELAELPNALTLTRTWEITKLSPVANVFGAVKAIASALPFTVTLAPLTVPEGDAAPPKAPDNTQSVPGAPAGRASA